ncbi:MAG: hypothetical protein Q8R37_05470 [Nanoarchaeota archaeon]|nr:hypothetical protein [Nanoarchaeota archaeon]
MVIGKRGIWFIVSILVLSFVSLTVLAEEPAQCIYYYYGNDCFGCADAENHLGVLQLEYPSVEMNKFEVYTDFKHLAELEKYYDAYNVPETSRGVPAVFIGQHYFIGFNPIENLLEDVITAEAQINCPSLNNSIGVVGVVGENAPYKVLDTLSLALVTPAAVNDAFSPSMLALVLIFLTIIMALKDNDVMVRWGTLSIIGIYTAFVVRGLDLFTVLHTPLLSTIFTKIVALLAIVYGLANIKGFFSTWKIFFGTMPEELQLDLTLLVKSLLTPAGIFLISFFSALFTLGERSTVFSILRMLTLNDSSRAAAFPLYLYHLFILIVPLIVLLVTMYLIRMEFEKNAKKKEPFDDHKVELWKNHLFKVLSLVVTVITIIIGLVLLLV